MARLPSPEMATMPAPSPSRASSAQPLVVRTISRAGSSPTIARVPSPSMATAGLNQAAERPVTTPSWTQPSSVFTNKRATTMSGPVVSPPGSATMARAASALSASPPGPAATGRPGPGSQAPGQVRMLRVLQHCDGPLRLGHVASALDVAPRSVTSKVDAAEADGLVRRIADPTDRRATLIELTDAGRETTRASFAPLLDGEAWVRELTVEQLRVVRDFLRLGAERNEAQAAHVRALPAREGRRGTRASAS